MAENSVDCNLFPPNDYYRDTLYDLDALITKIVEPEGLDGVLYAKDHHRDEEVNLGVDRDYRKVLASAKVRRHLWAIHLAGENHRLVDPNDREDREFLITLASTPLANPVRAALDIDPRQLIKLSTPNKIELLGNRIRGINQIQQAA